MSTTSIDQCATSQSWKAAPSNKAINTLKLYYTTQTKQTDVINKQTRTQLMGQDPKELTFLQSYLTFKINVLYFHLPFEVLKRMNIKFLQSYLKSMFCIYIYHLKY